MHVRSAHSLARLSPGDDDRWWASVAWGAGGAGEGNEVIDAAIDVIECFVAGWPWVPSDDGTDRASLVDGLCRASYEALAVVKVVQQAHRGAVKMHERATSMALPEAWLHRLVDADLDALIPLLGDWLSDWVQKVEARRGFITDKDGDLLVSRNRDAESIKAARDKLPSAAVEAVRSSGALWRGAGSEGRGATAAFPIRGAEGTPLLGVLVVQNRFVAEAFDGLSFTGSCSALVALVLRVRDLLIERSDRSRQLGERSAKRQDESTPTTEEVGDLGRQLEESLEAWQPEYEYAEIIRESTVMQRMLCRVDRVVKADALPVYLYGESGTGKDLVARAIHDHGPRAKAPYFAQNCSAIPHNLFESEFFGHEKGAFTGAERCTEGLFRRADGGTLFLDEIGELPKDLQAKLLRVLETGEVRPVGGQHTFKVDVRIICATHRDLQEQVALGTFREDLYYRLNVIRIDIPPLRDRGGDVALLANHFLDRRKAELGRPISLGEKALKRLIAYQWPGNVRQLENVVTRAALLCDGEIALSHLSEELKAAGVKGREHGRAMRTGAEDPSLDKGTLKERVSRLEAHILGGCLREHQGNKSRVARELGLSRAGLNMKLKRLGLWEVE